MTIKAVLFLFLLLSTLTARAHDLEIKNADDKIIYYNFINDSTELEVTYRGISYEYYYNEYKEDIVIPEDVTYMNTIYRVTSIGNNAFRFCYNLTSITIPNSVKSIGDRAFYGCSGLTEVTIPDNVTSLGDNVFSNCTSMKTLTIGNGITKLGWYNFYGCTSLTNVTIPNSVTSIGYNAFYKCTGLKEIVIPNNVTEIGLSAFGGCTSLTSITIPNSVTSIGWGAFFGCSSLTSVTIPNSVTEIGDNAFRGCDLTYITIPNSVKSIGERAFYGVDMPFVICLAEKPFAITGIASDFMTFSPKTFKEATLFVPVGSIDQYMAAVGWEDFYNIEEMTEAKCATPTATLKYGRLHFECETSGVTYHYKYTYPEGHEGIGNDISVSQTINLTLYATKPGLENSDEAYYELGTSGGMIVGIKGSTKSEAKGVVKSDIIGDVNGDGEIGLPDVMFIVNHILNGKFPNED
jgi:hypothetical protein